MNIYVFFGNTPDLIGISAVTEIRICIFFANKKIPWIQFVVDVFGLDKIECL